MEKESKTASLLDRWKNREIDKPLFHKIEKVPEGVKIPLSSGQKRLWFLQQIHPENPFYNYSETYTFDGELNAPALIQSLKLVYKNHDVLRTTYHIENNEVFQKLKNSTEIDVCFNDLSNLNDKDLKLESQKRIDTDAKLFFDLENGPVVRYLLLKINPKKHVLQITMHHIVTDKWSMRLFRDDLTNYYKAIVSDNILVEKKTKIQYTDYAYWQSKNKVNITKLNYWKNKLSGNISNLNLPTDFRRPLKPSFRGAASNTHTYSKELSANVLKLSKKLETTPYVLMLSVFYIFLQRFSGQNDISIGSPVTNRNQKVLEEIIGFFNETIVLRASISSKMTFKEIVRTIRETTLDAFANKDVPFETLVSELKVERSLAANPFFRVMFLYHSVPENPFSDSKVSLSHTWFDLKVSKFDLTLYVSEDKGILSSTFEYATDLFQESTINRFLESFNLVLDGVISQPDQTVLDIDVITNYEKHLTAYEKSTNDNNYFSAFKGIHNIIEQVAKKHPRNIALTFGDTSITYKLLVEKSNNLAITLLNSTKNHNEIVGLCVNRSIEMIIGMLAILKSGCAYLPIDPEYPEQRIKFMLEDAKVGSVITENKLARLFQKTTINKIYVNELKEEKKLVEYKFPDTKVTDLAYIIYTSGSSGEPKGVPITHKNIINSTGGRLNFYDNNPSSFLLMSSISFDSSKAGIFWTLCTGGNLVITEKRIEQDVEEISRIIERNKVSHALMLPSLYQVILDNVEVSNLKCLNTIIVAGEACSKSLCKTHFKTLPQVSLFNEYGPTEASVWCIAHKIIQEDIDKAQIPVGKPVANSQIHILNSDLQKVPFGVSGEIYIGGTNLSNGYFNRPDLTDHSFVNNPFKTDEKIYKTGDLAKYNTDGTIQFLGRIDQQVKIRGYRVELDDIEYIINKNTSVNRAIVLVTESEEKPKRLIAYVKPNNSYDEQQLKANLKRELPNYMIPSSFIIIDNIPLLPNGKVDKKALKNTITETITSTSQNIEIPKNETEQKLLDIWEETLNISPISTNDNFFEIGGDSILSIQIIAKARKNGIMLSPNQLFEYQTIAGLSRRLLETEHQKEEWSFIAKLRSGGRKNPLFCIHSGGGHVFFYSLLKKYLKKDRPIYAVQPVGLYGSEEMHQSVQEMTTEYLKAIREIQPNGPYNILVYCFSTSVGNEMAIQLSKIGEEINIIVADTMASPWNATDNDTLKARIFSFSKRLLMNPYKSIKTFSADRKYIFQAIKGKYFGKVKEKQLEELKANLRKISVNYAWKKNNGKVSLLLTDKPDKNFNKFIIKSWEKYAKGGVKIYPTKGNHTTLFEEPDIEFVSEQIDKCITD
jgi:amino acid adenylation domain-containing protein